MGVFVLICLAVEALIMLFHDSNFATASIIVMAIQWLAALGLKAGDSESAAKLGGAGGLAAIIICLLSLCSRDRGAFLLICAINFVASLFWGCVDSSESVGEGSTQPQGNEIWEVKRVRRIGRSRGKH